MAHSHGKVAVQFSMKKNIIVVGILAPGGYFSPALLSGGHFNLLLELKIYWSNLWYTGGGRGCGGGSGGIKVKLSSRGSYHCGRPDPCWGCRQSIRREVSKAYTKMKPEL